MDHLNDIPLEIRGSKAAKKTIEEKLLQLPEDFVEMSQAAKDNPGFYESKSRYGKTKIIAEQITKPNIIKLYLHGLIDINIPKSRVTTQYRGAENYAELVFDYKGTVYALS